MQQTFISPVFGGYYQLGFVTKDMKKATSFFTETLGVPGFMVMDKPGVRNQMLRGQPISTEVALAFGQWGATNIEVIMPLSGESTYTEMLSRYQWFGLHHIAIKVFDFDATIKDFEAQGFSVAQSGEVGEATRFAYLDMLKEMDYYLEVLFFDLAFEALFDKIRRGDF